MSVADEIKSRIDIVQYVSRTVSLKRAGRTYKACCPFHSERTPSFVVDPQRQTWRCFGACSTGGDVFTFAMRQNGWTFTEALQELGKLAGVEVRPRSPEQQAYDNRYDRLRGLLKSAAEFYHQRLLAEDRDAVRVLEYARSKRSLNDETLQKFMIGYAPPGWTSALETFTALGYSEEDLLEVGLASRNEESGRVYDRFRNRLMIPIRDERGRTVGFGARALAAEDNPKYLNSPQTPLFDKSRLLFALDLAGAAIRQSETVVIVEGYLDAIQAHQAGYSNVVAQMGTALTDTQIKLVAPRWAKKIILALDSDAAGQSATMRSLEVARQTLQADYSGHLDVDIRIITVPDAKDPDDLIKEHPEDWGGLVENALPLADYVIAMETAGVTGRSSLQEREAIARRLLPLLNASENNLYNKDNLQKLAVRLRIPERDLLSWASEQDVIKALKPPRAAEPPPQTPPGFDDPFGDLPPFFDPLDGYEEPLPLLPPSAPVLRDSLLERDCLRLLLQQPDLIYIVNRKLRELANGDEMLLAGALNDLNLDDFSRTEYQMLASVFGAALEQDELEPLDYVRHHLDEVLLAELEGILTSDLEMLRPHLRYGLSVDLLTVVQQIERSVAPVDPAVQIVQIAFKLRLQRLKRTIDEIKFLQMENEMDGDYNAHILQTMLARGRIEAQLKQQTQPRVIS
jgi:DNA primase